jgi:hypothetical protein
MDFSSHSEVGSDDLTTPRNSKTVDRRAHPVKTDETRDALLTEFGKDTLRDRYLLPGETNQDLFARVASAYADDAAHAQRVYDYISKLWFMPATPVLSNGGTGRGLPISCYLNSVADSLDGIVGTWNENVWLASRDSSVVTPCARGSTVLLVRTFLAGAAALSTGGVPTSSPLTSLPLEKSIACPRPLRGRSVTGPAASCSPIVRLAAMAGTLVSFGAQRGLFCLPSPISTGGPPARTWPSPEYSYSDAEH